MLRNLGPNCWAWPIVFVYARLQNLSRCLQFAVNGERTAYNITAAR